jgi:ABC-2 type transport system permease protein
MVTQLVRHELRSLQRDGILLIALGVFGVSLLAATFSGRQWAQRQAEIVSEVVKEDATRYEFVTARLLDIEQKRYVATDPYEDPSRPSIAGGWMAHRFATMAPGPLTALTTGHSDLRPLYAGSTIWSVAWPSWLNRRVLVGDSEIDNPLNLVTGRFDLAFVVVYLLPLLIITLTYGVIADEREGGTLALVASQGVGLPALISAKLLARAMVVAVAVLIIALASVAAMTTRDLAGYVRLGMWLTTAVSYATLWFALAAVAITLRGTAATNAMRLASTWVAIVVVLPVSLNAMTAWLYPLPERAVMVQRARAAHLAAARANSALTESFYDQHPELMPKNAPPDVRQYSANTVYAEHLEVERVLAPIVAEFESQLAAQAALITRLEGLSPASAAVAALADAAGTGPEREEHFRQQVDALRRAWRSFFVPRMFRLERISAADVPRFPRFHFRDEQIADVAVRVARRIVWLVVPAVALLAWSAVRYRRLTVLE